MFGDNSSNSSFARSQDCERILFALHGLDHPPVTRVTLYRLAGGNFPRGRFARAVAELRRLGVIWLGIDETTDPPTRLYGPVRADGGRPSNARDFPCGWERGR